MINSTNTISIDEKLLNEESFTKAFDLNSDDSYTKWIVKPLAVLSTIAVGVVALFTGALMMMAAIATLPLIALSAWALKNKVERELADAEVVIDGEASNVESA